MAVTDQLGCSLRYQPSSFSFGDILHVIFVIILISLSFCLSVGWSVDRSFSPSRTVGHTPARQERKVEEQEVDSRARRHDVVLCVVPACISIIHQQIPHLS